MKQTIIIEDTDQIKVEKSDLECFPGIWIDINKLKLQGSDKKLAELALRILLEIPTFEFEKVFDLVDRQRHDTTWHQLDDKVTELQIEIDRLKGDMY